MKKLKQKNIMDTLMGSPLEELEQITIMKKLKPKNIHLSEECIKQLSKDAIDAGTDFKNYVQNHLEGLAVKAVRQKKQKNGI